jgi:predicted nucleic acid-binding protein
MEMASKYVVDTNVLLRYLDQGEASHPVCVEAIDSLRKRGNALFVLAQSQMELAALLTRPLQNNGYGLSIADTEAQLQLTESLFDILPETPEVYIQWRRLFATIGASGRQVHDMRIAAAMSAHGVEHILTFNGDDFKRYAGITVVHPSDVALHQEAL